MPGNEASGRSGSHDDVLKAAQLRKKTHNEISKTLFKPTWECGHMCYPLNVTSFPGRIKVNDEQHIEGQNPIKVTAHVVVREKKVRAYLEL